jgi:N-acetylglucosamine kinase-like BadF-type ATPase
VIRDSSDTTFSCFPQITRREEMIPLLYERFSKATIASFAVRVVAGARLGDAESVSLLRQMGVALAEALAPLARKADASLRGDRGKQLQQRQ